MQHLYCDAALMGRASWCGALMTFGIVYSDFQHEYRKHLKA